VVGIVVAVTMPAPITTVAASPRAPRRPGPGAVIVVSIILIAVAIVLAATPSSVLPAIMMVPSLVMVIEMTTMGGRHHHRRWCPHIHPSELWVINHARRYLMECTVSVRAERSDWTAGTCAPLQRGGRCRGLQEGAFHAVEAYSSSDYQRAACAMQGRYG
jgi:hypothetical protein